MIAHRVGEPARRVHAQHDDAGAVGDRLVEAALDIVGGGRPDRALDLEHRNRGRHRSMRSADRRPQADDRSQEAPTRQGTREAHGPVERSRPRAGRKVRGALERMPRSGSVSRPWQCLYFLPEPQGQGALRGTLPQLAGGPPAVGPRPPPAAATRGAIAGRARRGRSGGVVGAGRRQRLGLGRRHLRPAAAAPGSRDGSAPGSRSGAGWSASPRTARTPRACTRSAGRAGHSRADGCPGAGGRDGADAPSTDGRGSAAAGSSRPSGSCRARRSTTFCAILRSDSATIRSLISRVGDAFLLGPLGDRQVERRAAACSRAPAPRGPTARDRPSPGSPPPPGRRSPGGACRAPSRRPPWPRSARGAARRSPCAGRSSRRRTSADSCGSRSCAPRPSAAPSRAPC